MIQKQMETESAGQAGACTDYDLVFDFDEEHMVHSLNSQMTSIHPQNETAVNLCGVRWFVSFCMNTHLSALEFEILFLHFVQPNWKQPWPD